MPATELGAFQSEPDGGVNHSIALVGLFDTAMGCADYLHGFPDGGPANTPNFLLLGFQDTDGGAIVPGTYYFDSSSNPFPTFEMSLTYPDGGSPLYLGAFGSIVLTTADEVNGFAGTFSVYPAPQLADAGAITGSFQAPYCPGFD